MNYSKQEFKDLNDLNDNQKRLLKTMRHLINDCSGAKTIDVMYRDFLVEKFNCLKKEHDEISTKIMNYERINELQGDIDHLTKKIEALTK